MDKANEAGQVAAEPINVIESPIIVAVPSNEQGIELTATGEMAVIPEEPVKKRSKIRLIAIVVALNVSFVEPFGLTWRVLTRALVVDVHFCS
jgi:hypothetical protein